jgi:hypothetical protein
MIVLLVMFATTIAFVWMCFDIGRRSVPGAVLTFVLVLPALYFLYRGWRDKRYDIRTPFFASIGGVALIACLAVITPAPAEESQPQSNSPVATAQLNG